MRGINSFAAAAAFASTLAAPLAAHAGLSVQVMELAKQCAPNVNPLTMGSLVAHESRNNPLAINVNGNYRLPRQPASPDEAVDAIAWLEAHGMNFDVGYGQVNSANFSGLGLSGRALLDACTNLRASAVVLTGCYARAVQAHGEGQPALLHALSCYNTGSQTRGFANGYVSKVVAQVRVLQIPALMDASGGATSGTQPVSSPADGGGKAIGKQPVKAAAINEQEKENQGAFSHEDPGAFGSAQPETP